MSLVPWQWRLNNLQFTSLVSLHAEQKTVSITVDMSKNIISSILLYVYLNPNPTSAVIFLHCLHSPGNNHQNRKKINGTSMGWKTMYRYLGNVIHTCVTILHLHTLANSCQTEKERNKHCQRNIKGTHQTRLKQNKIKQKWQNSSTKYTQTIHH